MRDRFFGTTRTTGCQTFQRHCHVLMDDILIFNVMLYVKVKWNRQRINRQIINFILPLSFNLDLRLRYQLLNMNIIIKLWYNLYESLLLHSSICKKRLLTILSLQFVYSCDYARFKRKKNARLLGEQWNDRYSYKMPPIHISGNSISPRSSNSAQRKK